MKVINTIWFTGMYGFCGIVLGEDSISGERKAYLGVHAGQSEAADQQIIADGGAKLPRGIVVRILNHLDKKEG